MSLMSELEDLGELMADNLVTMGVTDADASDGLTTLANKILDVPVTPVTPTLTLTGDKSVLSYSDSDTLTLTATLTGGSVSGKTIEFYNGFTSIGTATTNSSGVATITYSATGDGDVVFSATGNNLTSQPITVEDCMLYDATEYNRTGTGSATSVATNNKTWDNTIDWELTAEIKVTGNACRIDVVPPTESLNHHFGIGKSATGQLYTYVGKTSSGEESQGHSQTISNNTYYTVKVVKEGTTVKFYFEGTLIRTDSTTATNWIGNYSTESVKFTTWASNTIYMKNLSVKPLNSISLVASQSILSYADSDSTTLTATHSLGTGKTVNLYNASDDTLIGAMTDNEDGTYSYTYNSQGIGDLTVYASDGNLSSEDMLIEDCFRYDDASTDKTSNYSSANLSSLTHSTDHYEAVRSLGSSDTSKFYSPIYIDDTLPTDYEISVDISTSIVSSAMQNMISIASSHLQTYSGSTEFGILSNTQRNTVFSRNNGTGSFKDNNNQNLSANTYYNYNLKVDGTTVTATIKDMQGNTKYSNNMTVSFAQDLKKWSIIVGETAHTVKFKNLKIKAL